MTHLIVFGHSIAQGYWDTEGGWVQRLRTFLDKRYLENYEDEYDDFYYEVFNQCVSGEDTGEVLERFEREVKPRIYDEEKNIVIFHTGKNDIHIHPDGEPRKTGEQFRRDFTSLLEEAKKEVEKIIVVGEGYVGDIKYSPGSDKTVDDERLENFEKIKKEMCNEKEIPYVDIRSKFSRREWKKKLEDGFHPSNDGHQIIYHEVKSTLEKEDLI
jgi:lysophospholipase L1-like esterase